MKKIMILCLVFGMLCGGFALADFVTNQKLNLISEMASASEDIIALAARCKKISEAQSTIQIVEADITGGLLNDSAFEGMTWAEISNAFGSLDNLNATWYSTQGVNLRAVAEKIK